VIAVHRRDRGSIYRHAKLAQDIQEAAFAIGHPLVQRQGADDPDGPMPQVDQVMRRQAAALAIVGAHRWHAGHRAVHQDDGQALLHRALDFGQDRVHFVAQAVNRAAKLLRADEFEIGNFAFRVVLTVARTRVAAVADAVLGAQRKRRKVRIANVGMISPRAKLRRQTRLWATRFGR
jgi:hypothetical protein